MSPEKKSGVSLLACSGIWCAFSVVWIVSSYQLHVQVNSTMRRELDSFGERLKSFLTYAESAVPPDLWEMVAAKNSEGKTSVLGLELGETFEQMVMRLRRRATPVMWPGVLSFLVSFVFLLIALSEIKNAPPQLSDVAKPVL